MSLNYVALSNSHAALLANNANLAAQYATLSNNAASSSTAMPPSYSSIMSYMSTILKPVVASTTTTMPSVTKGSTQIDVTPLFGNPSSAPMVYSIVGNPNGSATISGSNLIIAGNYRAATYTVTVAASNAFGYMVSAPISITEGVAPSPTSIVLSAVTLSNNTVTWPLSSYFSTSADTAPLYYYLSANPKSNASIVSGILSVAGSNRGLTYSVSVAASNAYGKIATSSATVTEGSLFLPGYNGFWARQVGLHSVSPITEHLHKSKKCSLKCCRNDRPSRKPPFEIKTACIGPRVGLPPSVYGGAK